MSGLFQTMIQHWLILLRPAGYKSPDILAAATQASALLLRGTPHSQASCLPSIGMIVMGVFGKYYIYI